MLELMRKHHLTTLTGSPCEVCHGPMPLHDWVIMGKHGFVEFCCNQVIATQRDYAARLAGAYLRAIGVWNNGTGRLPEKGYRLVQHPYWKLPSQIRPPWENWPTEDEKMMSVGRVLLAAGLVR